MDYDELEPLDRAECPACNGTGNVTVILGDDEMPDRCPDCLGTGVQMTRDEMANLADLRLVPDPEPVYRDHAEEIAALMKQFRRTA